VKVRRPGVVDAVTLDLELIRSVAAQLSRSSQRVRSLDTMDLVEQYSTTMRQELDYAREAKDAELFSANLAGGPYVRVPAVHHELSTARVLMRERLKIDDLDVRGPAAHLLVAGGIDRLSTASTTTDTPLRPTPGGGW
jgi:ubiquinone biosynthesis protein